MRKEIEAARQKIAEDNPWYTADQIAGQRLGVYRHIMKGRYDYVVRHLRRLETRGYTLDGKTVVDLGCGDGQWSIEIARHFPKAKLIGVDYNELRLERYKHHVPTAEALFGSCLEVPLEDNSADFLMFHQVLEHIPQPQDALREVRRILKPDGRLLLSVPNEGTWLKQKVQYPFIERKAMKTTDHVNFWTRETLRRLLRANGFRVQQLDAMGFYFPHNGVSRRIVGRKPLYHIALAASHVAPVLRDCLFAWCRLDEAKTDASTRA